MTIGNIGNCPYAIFGVGAKKGLDMNNSMCMPSLLQPYQLLIFDFLSVYSFF